MKEFIADIVMPVIFMLLMFIAGFVAGVASGIELYRTKAIEHNCALISPITGIFEWKDSGEQYEKENNK